MTAVTPAYREVLPSELTGPDHPEWFAARQTGVTASEIAAVLGISPWESPYSLYWRKRGVLPEQPDTDSMRWGRRLERHIADEFAERHPEFWVMDAGLYAHARRPWQMASPDRLVFGETWQRGDLPVSVLEAKTTGSWDGWGDDGSDQVPLHIRAQALWQADVLSVDQVYVPVVNGRTYREYVVPYDPSDAGLMRWKALDFLQHVADEIQPDVDGSDATLKALRHVHPDMEDIEATVPADLAQQYRLACRAVKAATDLKHLAEARLRDAMGRAHCALDPAGGKVAVRSVYEVAEHVRRASTVDKLIPARTPKEQS